MQLKRSVVAALSAAALGMAGLAATAAPAQAVQDSGATASAPTAGPASTQAVYYLNFQYSSWSHWSPDSLTSTHAGWLYAGRSYVYCYRMAEVYTDKGRTDGAWFLTDDDSGNSNVWVSKVYLDPADWDTYVPKCRDV
ncbi:MULTISPECIES: hypothetical protein [unclassified Streptomyces]|uniref:hypothetical protein n=1 Tax=unclassified Streptomyces TaxID=2593676 RepID=UPI0016606D5B|nr:MULTISPECIES: hypothetical protein [unclassified Streptomyces]MBD0707293.1 hypothetical protein [Streptomyces sp. CBMA291]